MWDRVPLWCDMCLVGTAHKLLSSLSTGAVNCFELMRMSTKKEALCFWPLKAEFIGKKCLLVSLMYRRGEGGVTDLGINLKKRFCVSFPHGDTVRNSGDGEARFKMR